MDRHSKLVGLGLALCCLGAHAGYALPAPPPGFGGSPGGWTFTPASNMPTIGGGNPASNHPLFKGPGPSIAGSGPSTAAYRLGSGAARTLARGIVLGAVPGALALGALWLAQNCFEKQGGAWVRTCFPDGEQTPVSDGRQYSPENETQPANFKQWYDTPLLACGRAAALYNVANPSGTVSGPFLYDRGFCTGTRTTSGGTVTPNWSVGGLTSRVSTCPVGWYVTSAGCVQTPAPVSVTPQQVEDGMATKPLPSTLPSGIPYPVEIPWFNPILDPSGNPVLDPSGNPQRSPLLVPQGQPQKVPDTDPQKWKQPITTVTAAPTPADPWRMDVQPGERISSDPTGMTSPGPSTGTETDPKPTDDPLGLCDQYPDILACKKLEPGELAADPIKNTDTPLAINAETGFPTGGQCPAPKTHVLMGKSFSFSLQPLCDFATMIKPLMIGFAWLMAAMTFMGIARREN